MSVIFKDLQCTNNGPNNVCNIHVDLNRSTDDSNLILFADDTTVFLHDRCLKTLFVRVNRSLCNIKTWLNKNYLNLIEQKTRRFVFHHKRRRRLALGNALLDTNIVVGVQ